MPNSLVGRELAARRIEPRQTPGLGDGRRLLVPPALQSAVRMLAGPLLPSTAGSTATVESSTAQVGERFEHGHFDGQVGVNVIVAHEPDHSAAGQLPISWLTSTSMALASVRASVRSPRVKLSWSPQISRCPRAGPSPSWGYGRVCARATGTTIFEIAAASSPSGRQPSGTNHVRLRCVHRGSLRSPFVSSPGRATETLPSRVRSSVLASGAHRPTALSGHRRVPAGLKAAPLWQGYSHRAGPLLPCSSSAPRPSRWSFRPARSRMRASAA